MRFVSKDNQSQKVWWVEVLVIGVGCLLAIRTGLSTVRLWRAGERLDTAKIEYQQAVDENLRLKGQLAQAESDEFVEREARNKLGLGKEGEVILILPKQNLENPNSEKRNSNEVVLDNRPNWRKWWDLYVRI